MGDPPQASVPRPGGAADWLARSAALTEGLPAAFTADVLDPADPALAGVFMAGSHGARLRTGMLPVPMRREISWWVAACHASGERQIHASEWNRWAATAADMTRRRPEVCSFAGLDLGEWMTAWGRVFHAGHDRMASAASRSRAEIALGGLLRQLAIRYSDDPWWRHDIWSLRLDPRIPRRPHESRGNTAVRWDKLEPAWLREGFKFHLRLQLESGQLTWSSVMNQRVIAFRFAAFLASRNISHPALADDPGGLRAVALDFRTFLHGWTRTRPGRAGSGGGLEARTIARSLQAMGPAGRHADPWQSTFPARPGRAMLPGVTFELGKETGNVYVGIDVHRKRSQVAVIDQEGKVLANRNVPNGVKPILGVIGGLPCGTRRRSRPRSAGAGWCSCWRTTASTRTWCARCSARRSPRRG